MNDFFEFGPWWWTYMQLVRLSKYLSKPERSFVVRLTGRFVAYAADILRRSSR